MMRCEDIQTRLVAYTLGELSSEERRNVQAHLLGCDGCREALVRMDWQAAVLIEAETPPLPAGLHHKVMDAARSRQRARVATDWNPFKWWRMTTAPLHAAVAIILVIGLTVGLSMGRTMLSGQDRTDVSLATTQTDPLDMLNIGFLDGAPDDSLAGAYVALTAERDKEEQ